MTAITVTARPLDTITRITPTLSHSWVAIAWQLSGQNSGSGAV